MQNYQYYICDVFTDQRFGGNPLAVITDARGLTDLQMQQIAREFNFSETTFVLPPEKGHTCRVRIFTPVREVPFAGHPNIGTAFILATEDIQGIATTDSGFVFEEAAGLVSIQINTSADEGLWCELKAPQQLTIGKTVSVERIARAISLEAEDIIVSTHAPQVASVGLPFLLVELRNRSALEQARANPEVLAALATPQIPPDLHLYVHTNEHFDLRARMFAPLDGMPEDPATGSANCALAGLLAHYDAGPSMKFKWRIAQGVEMGRPSVLNARAQKKDGSVTATWIGGKCVLVSKGIIYVD